jgi:hypothetical protein
VKLQAYIQTYLYDLYVNKALEMKDILLQSQQKSVSTVITLSHNAQKCITSLAIPQTLQSNLRNREDR